MQLAVCRDADNRAGICDVCVCSAYTMAGFKVVTDVIVGDGGPGPAGSVSIMVDDSGDCAPTAYFASRAGSHHGPL